MRLFVLGLFLLLFVPFQASGQALQISETPNTRAFSSDQFLVAGHQIDLSERGLSNSRSAVNNVSAISASLNSNQIVLFSGTGSKMKEVSYEMESDDESVKLYVKPNGGFIIRENIANFLFYDPDGNIQQSISNSSKSTEGESVSELAADPMFKTVVLYNPKIIQNGAEGSRARVVNFRGGAKDIFYSSDRFIKNVFVSDNGQFVAIVTAAQGSDDQVEVRDRHGSHLGAFTFNQPIAGVKFSDDGRYITVRSNGRVGVYSVTEGEREGSTSFRDMLQYAEYVPEDENIIALTASKAGNNLTGLEFHAINLSARSIERQEYSGQVGVSELLPISMERTGINTYTFTGLSKILNVSVNF